MLVGQLSNNNAEPLMNYDDNTDWMKFTSIEEITGINLVSKFQ
jgi:hypothetical protein